MSNHRTFADDGQGGGGGGGAFPGFGTGIPGPSARGAAGTSLLVRRTDQVAPAFRSDLPLAATWYVDPVNGVDTASGVGSATNAIKTMAQLRKLWWSADITQNTTVNILGNVPAGDSWAFNTRIAPGFHVTFIGSLGATTGGGGVAIDNTLFTGAVTTYTAGSATPAADDIQMSDTSIPVSYTASGLLAKGVVFRRTVTATRHWYAAKDLGTKTIRIFQPMNNSGQLNFSTNTLTPGDAYSAFAMWTFPPQTFGFSDVKAVRLDTLHEIEGTASGEGGGPRGYGPIRSRCYIGTRAADFELTFGIALTNCCVDTGIDTSIAFATNVPPGIIGGGFKGTGQTRYVFFGVGGIGGACVFQGCRIEAQDRSDFSIEAQIAIHDTGASAIHSIGGGYVSISQVGVSGKGNTGKLLLVDVGGELLYGLTAALPPFVAGSTTDVAPIQVGSATFAVGLLPAVAETLITPTLPWPDVGRMTEFETPEIDLTVLSSNNVMVPTRAGYYFVPILVSSAGMIKARCTAAAGALTTSPTTNVGNNGAKNNYLVSSVPNISAIFTGGVGTVGNVGGNTTVVMTDMATSIKIDVTVAATGVGLTFKVKYLIMGSYVKI